MLPIITNPAPYPGNSGSPFGPRTALALTASQKLTLPAGIYEIITSANDEVMLTYASGLSDVLVGKSASGMFVADGTNVQVVNDGTVGAGTVYYLIKGL